MTILTLQVDQSSDDGTEATNGAVAINSSALTATSAGILIGVRLRNAAIPQGATILSARLTFRLDFEFGDSPNFNIYAQAADNATTMVASNNNISSRGRTSAAVNWAEVDTGTGDVDTPDLSPVVQEVVNRTSWGGDGLFFILEALPGAAFTARAWDFSSSLAPILTVEYIVNAATSPLSFYLITEKLPTVFTGKVAGTLADPYMTIPGNGGATGSFGAPLPGMTVLFDGDDQKSARLRSWTPGATGSFTISVGENDDITQYVGSGEDLEIVAQFRLWPIYPRITLTGDIATIYVDYDIPYTDQLQLWKPVAVAGPPAVVEWNGATAQARFVGDRSFALAPSATISGWLWTAPGSVEGSSTSQGTEASPVIFTYASPGQKLVYLKVTDTNGKTATNYTWVFVVNPNDPAPVAYTEFDSLSDNFDYEQGGGAASFIVHGNASVTDFPNEALVIMASRPTTPAQVSATGYWPFRDNVHFVGFVMGDSVKQNPIEGDTSFQAATIDALMRNLTVFPVSLTDTPSPFDWTQAYALITDRAASYLWHYYSTLSLMAPIVPSEYQPLIWRQDFGPSDLLSQLNNELMASLWGKVVVNHQGVIHHLIDYNLMVNAERSEVSIRKTLHKGIWVDDVTVEERMAYSQPVSTVKASGVYYPGGQAISACPSFSEAPGNAPKPFGKEMAYDRLIIASQADLNIRTGRALAKATPKYSGFTMRFINDGSFTIAPQELFPSNIEAGDNNRGLALAPRLIPRRISRRYDHSLGLIDYSISFEPETDGPPGVTVDLPCGPPQQVQPENEVPESPDGTAPTAQGNLALANEGSSFYFTVGTVGNWERRVKNLPVLNFQDMIPDPWTYFKNGRGVNSIIFWGCGPNFLAKSADSGKNWGPMTPYLPAPPNSWSDGAAPSITGTLVKQVLGDYFRQNNFYCLLQSQSGSDYRAWIYHTGDDGFNWTTYALTGTSTALPIRMDMDKQDGTVLWVTVLENGTINLRKYSVTAGALALLDTIALDSGVSVADIEAHTLIAYPLAPLGDKDLVYIFGRLVDPAGLSGTIAIMKSTDGGSNFSEVIGDWGEDHCGALQVGPADGFGNRAVWAVRQPELE